MRYGNRKIKTYAEYCGEEIPVTAHVFVQPREVESNTSAGVELEWVARQDSDEDVMAGMTDAAIECLTMRLYEEVFADESRY
jgi:hypothetical protein